MKVLLIGGGGREHALAWRLSQSEKCEKLYCAPGNPGIAQVAECAAIAVDDIDGLVRFAVEKKADFVVAGPETPLVLGLADRLREKGIPVFGPSQAAARLEGSKGFMKDLCARHGVPTAAYGRFTDFDDAAAFIRKNGAPVVVKADGLAAGKGVVVAASVDEALDAAKTLLAEKGAALVVEEFIDGEELSFFALADGETVLTLASAQDHKRAFDGDRGPNTGGMGAYSPAHLMTPELGAKIEERIIKPVVAGMKAEGCPFSGVLFAGIMVKGGEPYLLEFNVRFGDPECQALMMRFEGDLLDLLYACAAGRLAAAAPVSWTAGAALCVVMAAKGYPGPFKKDTVIKNVEAAEAMPGIRVFHAGTRRGEDGALLACGGRVLGVSAAGRTVAEAHRRAYGAVDAIQWNDGFCRRDIGGRALEGNNITKTASTSR